MNKIDIFFLSVFFLLMYFGDDFKIFHQKSVIAVTLFYLMAESVDKV